MHLSPVCQIMTYLDEVLGKEIEQCRHDGRGFSPSHFLKNLEKVGEDGSHSLEQSFWIDILTRMIQDERYRSISISSRDSIQIHDLLVQWLCESGRESLLRYALVKSTEQDSKKANDTVLLTNLDADLFKRHSIYSLKDERKMFNEIVVRKPLPSWDEIKKDHTRLEQNINEKVFYGKADTDVLEKADIIDKEQMSLALLGTRGLDGRKLSESEYIREDTLLRSLTRISQQNVSELPLGRSAYKAVKEKLSDDELSGSEDESNTQAFTSTDAFLMKKDRITLPVDDSIDAAPARTFNIDDARETMATIIEPMETSEMVLSSKSDEIAVQGKSMSEVLMIPEEPGDVKQASEGNVASENMGDKQDEAAVEEEQEHLEELVDANSDMKIPIDQSNVPSID